MTSSNPEKKEKNQIGSDLYFLPTFNSQFVLTKMIRSNLDPIFLAFIKRENTILSQSHFKLCIYLGTASFCSKVLGKKQFWSTCHQGCQMDFLNLPPQKKIIWVNFGKPWNGRCCPQNVPNGLKIYQFIYVMII
jgi:hypothetical protein